MSENKEELTFPREMIIGTGEAIRTVHAIVKGHAVYEAIYGELSIASIFKELPTPKKKRLANRNEWLKWSASCNLGDDVWVVCCGFDAQPDEAVMLGSNPPAFCFGLNIENYWRSKLDESGIPIQWEQFWIEE